MDERELRRLLRSQVRSEPARTWKCPEPSELAAYADGHLPEGERPRLESHLAQCDYCLREVACLAQLHDAPAAEVPPELLRQARALEKVPGGAPWMGWRWATASAVLASLVVGASLWLNRPAVEQPRSDVPALSTGQAPPTQAAPQPAGTPSAASTETPPGPSVRNGGRQVPLPSLIFPPENAVVSTGDVEFRWKALPQALFYEVRVVSAEGDLLWEQRVEDTRARMPRATAGSQQGKIFVSVRAHLPDGQTMKSQVVGFWVRKSD